jgi:phospholipid/cholesterol/gamma-HCH transport system substrate-binding protein
VPSRKEIQWSQLKVGILVLVAVAVLIGLVFLMSGSTGGLFNHKLTLRSYFKNASGLKAGAPVALEGVTIGNITKIRIVSARNPTPVEVIMQVGEKAASGIHTDSTTQIESAGVLGDSYLDITSEDAHGPVPPNNAELGARNVPSIQTVVDTSQDTLQKASLVMTKVNTLLDTVNSKRGSAGLLLNDPQLYNKAAKLLSNMEAITQGLSEGKGTLGKLISDDSMYNKLNATVDSLHEVSQALAEGRGSAGKLLHDEALYNNLNNAVQNTNKLLEGITAGKGALGKLSQDPAFAQKLDDTVSSLDQLLKGLNEGKGTLGQLTVNRALFDHFDQTLDQTQGLVSDIRKDPKKYLVIHLKIF